MKVLYTASTLSHIKNFHIPYLKWFKSVGAEVFVAAGDGRCEKIEVIDRFVDFPLEKSMLSIKNWRSAVRLARIIDREKFDVISCHTTLAAFFTRLAVMLCRNKPKLVASTCHGYLFDGDTNKFKAYIMLAAERLVSGVTDLLMVMNECDCRIALDNKLGKGIVKIPGMGIDLDKFKAPSPEEKRLARERLGISGNKFVLIYIAEFSKRKNHDMLIKAMEKLPENIFLICVGDGELLKACRKYSETAGMDSRILFAGYSSDVIKYIYAADLCVSASRYEGLPFNVMECLACGLPAVVSDVKGNSDLIIHGVNGYTYPYGDVDRFCSCIIQLSNEKNITGEDCTSSVKNLSIDKTLDMITERYNLFLY